MYSYLGEDTSVLVPLIDPPSGYVKWRAAKYAGNVSKPVPLPPATADKDNDGLPNAWKAYYSANYHTSLQPSYDLDYNSSRDGCFMGLYVPKRQNVPPGSNQILAAWQAIWDSFFLFQDPDQDGLTNLWEFQVVVQFESTRENARLTARREHSPESKIGDDRFGPIDAYCSS